MASFMPGNTHEMREGARNLLGNEPFARNLPARRVSCDKVDQTVLQRAVCLGREDETYLNGIVGHFRLDLERADSHLNSEIVAIASSMVTRTTTKVLSRSFRHGEAEDATNLSKVMFVVAPFVALCLPTVCNLCGRKNLQIRHVQCELTYRGDLPRGHAICGTLS